MRVDPRELRRRLRIVRRLYEDCRLCPHDCGVDRWRGARGVCGLGREARLYREHVHLGEERPLVPSHTVYLAGCSFRCAFCSDAGWVRDPMAEGTRPLRYREMAALVATRRAQGARNVNFVGGTPDVSLYAVLRTLVECPTDTRVVWNSNLWIADAPLALLDGVVDVHLPDYKFGNDDCAFRLAGVRGYTARVQRNLMVAAHQADVIVRHLVMPGHLECCLRPCLAWLREHLPEATVNVMLGFYPFDRMGRPDAPTRTLDDDEKAAAVALLRALDFPKVLLDGRPMRYHRRS